MDFFEQNGYFKKITYSENNNSSENDYFSKKGVYCLIFKNQTCKIEVGKKGEFSFDSGFHIYVGSALGSGGLKRVTRHIKISRNKDRNPRWHVDYLHLNPAFRLVSVVYAFTSERLECTLARRIGGNFVYDFGCTDCKCNSHLFYRTTNPLLEINEAFESLGLNAFNLSL
jgi:Uri superfamily endonuclease